MKYKIFTLVIFTLCFFFALSAKADNDQSKKYYLTDSDNHVVKSGFDICWRTGFWTPADAVEGCDEMIAKSEETSDVAEAESELEASSESGELPPGVEPYSEVDPEVTPESDKAETEDAQKEEAATAEKPNLDPPLETIILEADAYFEFDKSDLKVEGEAVLTDLILRLGAYNVEVIVVVGYTDNIGSEKYNYGLSFRRAKTVVDFLISQGVDSGRVVSDGLGESQPIADNNTRKGRSMNRRVEVEVIGKSKN
mgnify:CR=1 FL=1|tara:strand:- start:32 stop:790 length:759 start_codon:yes stop_codon:yes gene_type:complete